MTEEQVKGIHKILIWEIVRDEQAILNLENGLYGEIEDEALAQEWIAIVDKEIDRKRAQLRLMEREYGDLLI